MELKAKLVSRWAAYVLDCLKHLHQPRRKPEKRWYREEREREKERERKREEAVELGLLELKAKLVSAGLLLYWIALNTCTNPEESGKRDGIE